MESRVLKLTPALTWSRTRKERTPGEIAQRVGVNHPNTVEDSKTGVAESEADIRASQEGHAGLFVVAQRLDHCQELFVVDKSAVMPQLVGVDGLPQLAGFRREVSV